MIPDISNITAPSASSPQKNKMIMYIVAAVILMIACVVMVAVMPSSKKKTSTSSVASVSASTSKEDKKSDVKGEYSNEIFSGNAFDYITMSDTAKFTFNDDSTFECAYEGGNTYIGEYEVYNGLYIGLKADDIAEDTSIPNADQLARDIKNVSDKMMEDADSILHTYLLYLTVEKTIDSQGVEEKGKILQPFLVKYDTKTKTGTAVNIYGQVQGSFNER